MSVIRNNVIDLFGLLPPDVITEALPRVIGNNETKVLATLSGTCNALHGFFQPELEKRAAQKLLSLVLKPTQEHLEKAKKMWTANPRLLFIESEAEEYAAGLDENFKNVYRKVKASPIRAIVGASDIWLLREVIHTEAFKNYVDPESEKTAYELAVAEIKKQFPNGFDYPVSTYDYGPLIDAITKDTSLIQDNIPSDATKALLAKFRKDFLPGTVTSGYFFNINELVRAFELYNAKWGEWQLHQLLLFWQQVIGYFERLVSGVMGEVISQGIMNILQGKPLVRQYDFKKISVPEFGGDAMLDFRPLKHYFPLPAVDVSSDSAICLGYSSGVYSYYADGTWREVGAQVVTGDLQKVCHMKPIFNNFVLYLQHESSKQDAAVGHKKKRKHCVIS